MSIALFTWPTLPLTLDNLQYWRMTKSNYSQHIRQQHTVFYLQKTFSQTMALVWIYSFLYFHVAEIKIELGNEPSITITIKM